MKTESNNAGDMWHFEKMMMKHGYSIIAGIDEAGRGPLAGPVVAAAVILPFGCCIDGINDSKKLTPRKRESAFEYISSAAICIGIGIVHPNEIDRINILQATYKAMSQAASMLETKADICLIDGNPIGRFEHPYKFIVGGDGKSASIAAASIIAKVTRDKMMCEYDLIYPGYGFASHKGYGSESHLQMIREKGICEIHRKSFAPIKNQIEMSKEGGTVWLQKNLLSDD